LFTVSDSDGVLVDVLVLPPLAGRVEWVPVPGRLGAVTGEVPPVVVGVDAVVVEPDDVVVVVPVSVTVVTV
jgi:hypothetical protein